MSKANTELMRNGVMVDSFVTTEDGEILVVSTDFKKNPDRPDDLLVNDVIKRGTIVPDGDPIVTLDAWGPELLDPDGKDRQVFNRPMFRFGAEIDRVLDYNLPIYLEYQTQDRSELGGTVAISTCCPERRETFYRV